ncbi:MAG: class I SAM-dependent methyltransferase [Actinomycetota bacterium]|nr:class I SAM-dependent methyltransferase [Actinomycetota bacterium]
MSAGPDEQLWAEHGQLLERDGEIELPWVHQAARWVLEDIASQSPRHVLDVGAGPAVAACHLAELLPDTTVTALDSTPAFLERARARADRLGLGDRVRAVRGDLDGELPIIEPADLVWASHVVHHLRDPAAGLRRLRDLLSPTGLLVLAEGGLPMRVLPAGHGVGPPSLILRFEAALSDHWIQTYGLHAGAVQGERDWPVLIAAAGFESVLTRTFLLDLPAPVPDEVRDHLHERFSELLPQVRDRLDQSDLAALGRLVDADDPASIRRREDLFLLAAFTVHVGRRTHASRPCRP